MGLELHPFPLIQFTFSNAPLDESVTTAAAAVGAAKVFLLSEADVQGHPRFRIYNTITNRWAISDPLPLPATPLNLISDLQRQIAHPPQGLTGLPSGNRV